MFNIIGHKNIFLMISGVLVLASVLAFSLWGLRLGIDFTGGSLLEIEFSATRPDSAKVQEALVKAGIENALVQPSGEKGYILRFKNIDENKHQQISDKLRVLGGGSLTEKRFDSIGPTIGAELKKNSIIALALAIMGIVSYISWAFRKISKPVSSWKYGVATIVALVHDVMIPVGVFSALGRFGGVEVDTLFITALLTILGFSVHDTIVVFDRIRENLRQPKTQETFQATVNRSMNETLARSINTSFTVLLVIAAVFFWGASTTLWFSFALGIGIIFGTYSSIFIASPILVLWHEVGERSQ